VLLPVLVLVSGFCGISYEILYAKLLGNLLGDRFTISATVLLTFLLGIGLGTLYAHRWARWLWAIEGGIGLYAALLAGAYGWIDALLYRWVPVLGTSVAVCALASVALLAAPAFLVGCSVPLFAGYLGTLRSRQVFSATYGIYNVGAALTALGMEFVLLRVVGLRAATLCLAGLNGLVALGLLGLVRSAPVVPPRSTGRLAFARRDLAALAVASVGSAVFQLLMIKVAEFVLGPFNETFALVLAVVLLGLALGSLAAGWLRLSFAGALLLALAGLAALLALLPNIVETYAALRPLAALDHSSLVGLKLALVLAMMLLPAVGFGATIPALLRVHRDVAWESGRLLFVSSMGNVAGFLLMAFVLHRHLDYGPTLLVVAGLTALGLVLQQGWRRPAAAGAAALLALAAAAQQTLWRESYLYFGHDKYLSRSSFELARDSRFFAEVFKGHQDIFAITWRDGEPSFFMNGYISIPLTALAEKVAGALSVMYAPRTDDALVLGVGSGATAGTVGLFFDRTEAVDVNAVILANQGRMAEYNFDLPHQSRVTLVHDDGIHYIKTTPKRYSLIVNTVESPIYFSSSKLYTREFLETVVEHLTPDGVYTTWIDQDTGDRGVDIVIETLAEAFDACWLNYLKSSYYLLVCSNAEIRPHQARRVAAGERLDRYLIENDRLRARLIGYSLLSTDALALRSPQDVPVNTLDFPVLEHELARLGRGEIPEFNRRLEASLDLRRARDVFEGVMAWDPGEFALWADMRERHSEATLVRVLHRVIPRQFPDVDERYAQAALRLARELGGAEDYLAYGRRLYHGEFYRPALEALLEALRIDPAMAEARYYVGRCHEELGEYEAARESFRLALELDPEDEDLREALTRVGGAPWEPFGRRGPTGTGRLER
jgi:predicted membrane-bound spermidine synthase/tetratricopeptide (TPR) repeat protein